MFAEEVHFDRIVQYLSVNRIHPKTSDPLPEPAMSRRKQIVREQEPQQAVRHCENGYVCAIGVCAHPCHSRCLQQACVPLSGYSALRTNAQEGESFQVQPLAFFQYEDCLRDVPARPERTAFQMQGNILEHSLEKKGKLFYLAEKHRPDAQRDRQSRKYGGAHEYTVAKENAVYVA